MKKLLYILIATLISSNVYSQTFDDNLYTNEPAKKEEAIKKPEFFTPKQKNQPKKENIVRGPAKIQRVFSAGEKKQETPKIIFLSFEDFKISSIGSFKTTCSMRFTILTNLDQELNSIDLRLTWPDIKTTLSFNNVNPNQATYIDYTLMGEGCYSMDKEPNIEVNRCRTKGMSQDQCANIVYWISK